MSDRAKPTRRDLLIVIGRLQELIGEIAAASSDRNENRARDIAAKVTEGHALCIEATSFDPPIAQDGKNERGWP